MSKLYKYIDSGIERAKELTQSDITDLDGLPTGTDNQTLRNNAGTWEANSKILAKADGRLGLGTDSFNGNLAQFNVVNDDYAAGVSILQKYAGSYNTAVLIQAYDAADSLALMVKSNGGFRIFEVSGCDSDQFIKIYNNGESNYTKIYSGATTNWNLTLPANDGNAGQVLTTDGSGVTSWSDVSSADDEGWMRKNGLTIVAPFNANEASYEFTWNSATESENWNSDLNRSTSTKLVNNGSTTATVRDNCYALVQMLPSVIDFTAVTYAYVELWYSKYNSSNVLQESVMLDKQYVPFFNGGTTSGWCGVNLSVHGDITYKLAAGDYSKMVLKVFYDGQTPNVTIDNGFHEHEIINKK